MVRGREHAILLCQEFGNRLWSLSLAMLDHLDEPNAPSEENIIPMFTTCFSTYTIARRMFATVLSEEFSPRNFIHLIIISDYSHILKCDVDRDLAVLRNPNHPNLTSVVARWDSWHTIEDRWPFHVPADSSVLKKEALEGICREMWTSLRIVGETALVLGEGMPGDAAFSFTADGYRRWDGGGAITGPLEVVNLLAGWMRTGGGAGKLIKQD